MTTFHEPRPAATRWVAIPRPRPQARLRLFCFPYAGGQASGFFSWAARVPPTVEVCAVQLPGRANRFAEPAFVRLPALVSAVEDALMPLLDKPFAFFGHSMGALLAFEFARRLRKAHGLEPVHLFVSGARGPKLPSREPAVHALPDPEFLDALRHFEGTPDEVLQSAELMALVAPAVRADFAVCETYTYRSGVPLTCAITVFGGRRDRIVTRADLDAWASETTSPCTTHVLAGGHYFLREEEDRLLALVSAVLTRHVEGDTHSLPIG
jgi:medium-chain acyl-[acyl-carrier-protein] hydrolase